MLEFTKSWPKLVPNPTPSNPKGNPQSSPKNPCWKNMRRTVNGVTQRLRSLHPASFIYIQLIHSRRDYKFLQQVPGWSPVCELPRSTRQLPPWPNNLRGENSSVWWLQTSKLARRGRLNTGQEGKATWDKSGGRHYCWGGEATACVLRTRTAHSPPHLRLIFGVLWKILLCATRNHTPLVIRPAHS